MTRAGRKILRGAHEALAVARGEKLPRRITVTNEAMTAEGTAGLLAWVTHMLTVVGKGAPVRVQVSVEFPDIGIERLPATKQKKRKKKTA